MNSNNYLLIVLLLILKTNSLLILSDNKFCDSNKQLCDKDSNNDKYSKQLNENYLKSKRYLFYDLNFGEGFNLRRDVFMRMALLVNKLSENWSLILPKWSSVPHWMTNNTRHELWSTYFDLKSLNQFVSVIEFDDYINELNANNKEIVIDVIIALEHFADTFESDGNWFEHYSIHDCNQSKYYRNIDQKIINLYDSYDYIEYKRLVCVQIEGYVSTLKQLIEDNFSDVKTILISNAEVIIHSDFGDKDYWSARRSMRFNDRLISIGDHFRQKFLNSNDISDKTLVESDWRAMKRSERQAIGGQYLSVHLRRSDFAKWRSKDVPNIECAVKQIHFALNQYIPTNKVFIASDANHTEWKHLINLLNDKKIQSFRFTSDSLIDGEIAIVDQWIAAHAMLFIGTYESTFSFRIQEEREILGFSANTTFNALCAKCDHRLMLKLCKQESQWKIVY
jgi:peptide-O-fucosyltransferase